MEAPQILLAILIGVGLSAACGFRMFVPFLFISVAANAGQITLAPGFEWMAEDAAVITFTVATVIEILAYYIPWVQDALAAVATPAAAVAGTILTASMITDMSPFMKWGISAIAGGGTATTVHVGTVAARGVGLMFTGGLANFVVSTVELVGAAVMAFLAVFIPLAALALLVCLFVGSIVCVAYWLGKPAARGPGGPALATG